MHTQNISHTEKAGVGTKDALCSLAQTAECLIVMWVFMYLQEVTDNDHLASSCITSLRKAFIKAKLHPNGTGILTYDCKFVYWRCAQKPLTCLLP